MITLSANAQLVLPSKELGTKNNGSGEGSNNDYSESESNNKGSEGSGSSDSKQSEKRNKKERIKKESKKWSFNWFANWRKRKGNSAGEFEEEETEDAIDLAVTEPTNSDELLIDSTNEDDTDSFVESTNDEVGSNEETLNGIEEGNPDAGDNSPNMEVSNDLVSEDLKTSVDVTEQPLVEIEQVEEILFTNIPVDEVRKFEFIYFESAKWDVSRKGKAELKGISNYLKEHEGLRISIVAHTDSEGGKAENMELSKKRAKVITRFLKETGIEENRISAMFFGESYPVVNNSNAANKALNRRTEYVLFY
ncbi:MAG: OmpA family protein [Flavobacteriales bacterium]|nr:OmpA family protein [Flavobacteriales bacterium]